MPRYTNEKGLVLMMSLLFLLLLTIVVMTGFEMATVELKMSRAFVSLMSLNY